MYTRKRRRIKVGSIYDKLDKTKAVIGSFKNVYEIRGIVKIKNSLFFLLRFQKFFASLDSLRGSQLVRNIAVDNLESRITIDADSDVFVFDDSAVCI